MLSEGIYVRCKYCGRNVPSCQEECMFCRNEIDKQKIKPVETEVVEVLK